MCVRLRSILIALASSFCLSFLGCKDDPTKTIAPRPNIIFLLTDDLRYDALGYMGNENIFTPELDKLASDGVYFRNAYHISPICLPSRAGIMLGQYLGTHGAGFDSPTNKVITNTEFKKSYPTVLKENGYTTGFIGKFGFPVTGTEKIVSESLESKVANLPIETFDVWNGFPGQGSYLPKEGSFNGYENKWNAKHLNEFMGYQALDFIESKKDKSQPFCLSISFKAPHAPFLPEEDMRSLYETSDFPRKENDTPEDFARLPEVVRTKSRNALRYQGKKADTSWHLWKDENYQEFMKNYYGLISGVDRVVGRIRKSLEEKGLAKNTIIIFTSDNGFFCGSRQLTGKALLYEESVKAPLIVFDPRNEENGRVATGLISHVDLAPSILDYAGVDIPEEMQGESIVDAVTNKVEEIHKAVYGENNFDDNHPIASETDDRSTYQSIRSKFLRTKDFKFIRYHECRPIVEELWDMRVDSAESKNLIADPQYHDIAVDMREKLNAFETENVHYFNE